MKKLMTSVARRERQHRSN